MAEDKKKVTPAASAKQTAPKTTKQLAKKGYKVTIFEKEKNIGGLLTYGIPGFRLPRNITEKLKARIKNLNIDIITETEFGKDITLEMLKKE